jgi:hypothetical protein
MDDVGPESSSIEPGGCFRLVSVAGALIRCPERVEFEGLSRYWIENRHEVEACADHAEDLTDWSRISANILDISRARKPFPFKGPPCLSRGSTDWFTRPSHRARVAQPALALAWPHTGRSGGG